MPGISFVSPVFLIGIGAAAIPIALHLFLRRAYPVIPFSAIRFLKSAPVEQARYRRIREVLLLALRAAALGLLAIAFARPYTAPAALASGVPTTLVLIDTSASMTAPGQFERARTVATDAVRKAPADHAVGVLAFGAGVDVVASPMADRTVALSAIGRVKPGGGTTDYAEAFARASDLLPGGDGRIVVVTDLQRSGWESGAGNLSATIAIDVQDVGGADANLAVTSLHVEGTDAVATIRNYSRTVYDDRVSFSLDGRAMAGVPVTVPPASSVVARTPLREGATGTLSAAVADPGGYAADNTRSENVRDPGFPEVLLVSSSGRTSDAFYLQRALSLTDGIHGFQVRLVSAPALSDQGDLTTGKVKAVVIVGTHGLDRRGRERLAEFVEAGGSMWIAFGPEVDLDVLHAAMQTIAPVSQPLAATRALHFAPQDSRHPIFQRFIDGQATLSTVAFSRTARIDVGGNARTLARYDDGLPAMVEQSVGKGRVLMFASDLNDQWNNFPTQAAFVPFVHETLRYLTANPDRPDDASVTTNVDLRESDPARLTREDFHKRVEQLRTASASPPLRSRPNEQDSHQRLWQYAIVLMLVTLAAEGMLGR